MTFRELTYLVLDEIKQISDDSSFTEDHVIMLLNKYRSFLLKQRYSDIKKMIPESNYQTVNLEVISVPAMSGDHDPLGFNYLKSNDKVPIPIQIGFPRVYVDNYFVGEITYVTRDRMRYVGLSTYMNNIIYTAIGPDKYLYLKNPNASIFAGITTVNFTAIFLDAIEAININHKDEDILDQDFPIEESLIPPLIELCRNELAPVVYRPTDTKNNANDDLTSIPTTQPQSKNTQSKMS